ncbi:MAG: hypothetical protein H6718_08975 [Polyangiaceae bacterium]|nr:hypothetical protein [Myxococcales bacterium]MCB9585518.1 hypothetical protein [Polyangiaceae bacterium]MCB9606466.1 hypothetical protein [Polyangiaceae bacterium]
MRSQLLVSVCCLGLLVGCAAKERDSNVDNGGSAGQTSGGSGGLAGSGADGGMGGSAGTGAGGGSAGTTGGGGSTAGTGAGGAGGSAGTAGAGGATMLTCVAGTARELTTDTSLPPMDDEPNLAVTRCGEDGFIARETVEGVDFFRVRFGNDGNPIENQWSYSAAGVTVDGLSCDANNLKLLTRTPNGLAEWLFPLQGRDLQTPLNPTATPITIPSECIGQTNYALPSYNGGLHWMLDCHPNANTTKLVAGPPVIDFINGPNGEQLQLAAYAYAGGIHVGMNEQGEGWAGATAAQLGVTQKLAFEDPTLRPTALATITSNSAGFFVMGITVNQPPNLLPGKLFTGPVLPSKINDIFVGGSLPSSVKERRMITSTDEIGPTSPLATGMNTVVFSTINLKNQILFNIMKPDGEIRAWAQLIHDPTNGGTIRRTVSLTNTAGNGNFVAWSEYDSSDKYRAFMRSMICL